MSTLLADISLQVAQKVTTVLESVATAGDAVSLTDIVNLLDPNSTWDKGTLWILSGASIGKVAVISTYAANKLNFPSLGAALCTRQVETATVIGTVTGSGNATVIVTAAGMNNSPKTVSVAVLNGDTAAVVAGKIIAALGLDADISAFFTIGGATTNVVLTAIVALADDATLNISIANGTCTGLTNAPTSTTTTPGVAGPRYAVSNQDIPYNQIVSAINSALNEVMVSTEDFTLVGDGTKLLFALPTGVQDVYKVEFEHPGMNDRNISNHWEELNGNLRFDNGFAPYSGDIIHIWYGGPHPILAAYNDKVDDEVNLSWLRSQSTFNLLMWAKTIFGDDEDYDITTRLQVETAKLANLSPSKRAHVRFRSAGTSEGRN